MNDETLLDLIERISNNIASDADLSTYNAWCESFQEKGEQIPDFHQLQSKMFVHINQEIDKHRETKIRLFYRIAAVAASIIFVLFIGSYFLLHKESDQKIAKNDNYGIAPGSNRLVLILGNGKKIDLNKAKNGQLAMQGQTAITKVNNGQIVYSASNISNEDVQYNTVLAPRGGQGSLILADGTQVWLNASSSIKFPASFRGNQRLVTVTGEVAFKVFHNAKMPFRVIAAKQLTEDIGTEFNINAYPDEPVIKTTLLEGAVKVRATGKSTLLKPGQESDLNNNQLTIQEGDVQTAFAWKNGYLWFNNENIESVMRQVSRWYDIDVVYQGKITKDRFNGKISRYKNINQVLHMLEYSGSVHFKVQGRRIEVSQ